MPAIGAARLQLNVDVYNVANASALRANNATFGPRWLFVDSLMDPRIVVLSGNLSF